MFNVKLESFDPASKPKVIREVKALVPNLTLMDVRLLLLAPFFSAHRSTGQKVRRVAAQSPQRELVQGGCREATKGLRGHRRCC